MSPFADDSQPDQTPFNRAEEVLRFLHRRMERHSARESHLGGLYRGWRDYWMQQSDELDRHIARLEAHLTTWMPSAAEPKLSVFAEAEESAPSGRIVAADRAC